MGELGSNIDVLDLLKSDLALRNYLDTHEPQSIRMPFAGDKTRQYLMVSFFVVDKYADRISVAEICKRTLQILISNGVLRELDGIELMPCVMKNDKASRILRLSVLSDVLALVMNMDAMTLFKREPIHGATCIVYMRDF